MLNIKMFIVKVLQYKISRQLALMMSFMLIFIHSHNLTFFFIYIFFLFKNIHYGCESVCDFYSWFAFVRMIVKITIQVSQKLAKHINAFLFFLFSGFSWFLSWKTQNGYMENLVVVVLVSVAVFIRLALNIFIWMNEWVRMFVWMYEWEFVCTCVLVSCTYRNILLLFVCW